ncbi:MAG: hypothetical protein EOQ48_21390 [Mesorhizobium sp.]|uniref:hypothetical protein n=1 Tax=Mesorhizobium sp. TaxID=1871066 RepID=UPI000FE91C06|nr:hypothetical protein [Mesorhizobium sp.]RWA88193.1 MAG: hypothetical protein EOQ31_21885 [Mesorhizobium sp.]RWB58680.1 MAG: hypothetical protein EOQ48_21390 [Mesorhizobium sp.]
MAILQLRHLSRRHLNERLQMHDSHPSRTFQPAQLQGKAIARRRRESERLAVLEQFVQERKRAADLRNWIDTYAVNAAQDSETELTRMCEWARARLREYDLLLSPARLSTMLRDRQLFPAVDPLVDTAGEPAPEETFSSRPGPKTHPRRPNIL